MNRRGFLKFIAIAPVVALTGSSSSFIIGMDGGSTGDICFVEYQRLARDLHQFAERQFICGPAGISANLSSTLSAHLAAAEFPSLRADVRGVQ